MKNTPDVGQIVNYYPGSDRGQEPLAAVVTKVGNNSVCVSIFDSSNQNLTIRDGVRHVDDPRSRTDFGRSAGAWDFTDRDKQIDALLEQLNVTSGA